MYRKTMRIRRKPFIAFILVSNILISIVFYNFISNVGGDLPFSINTVINTDSGSESQTNPSIVMDSSGNIYVTWEDFRNGNGDIYFANSTDGGNSWSNPNIKINSDSGNEAQSKPSMAVDSQGNIYMVWEDNRNGNLDIYFSKSSDGGNSWSDPNIKLNSDSSSSTQGTPTITVDSVGNLYVAWEDFRNGDHDIYFTNSSDEGDTWSNTNIKVNSDIGSESQFSPDIGVDPNGRIYLIWEDYRNGDGDIFFANSSDGGVSWSDPNIKINSDSGSAEQYYPRLHIVSNNSIKIVWEDNRNGNSDIYYAQSTDSGITWTDPNLKVNNDIGTDGQYLPSIVVDEYGDAFVVWEDYRNGDSDLYYAKQMIMGSHGQIQT